MRKLIAALALAAMWILAAGCGSANQGTTAPTTTSAPSSAPAVAVAALDGLLLSPAEVSAAMGATGMTTPGAADTMGDESASVSDKACLPIVDPAQTPVYAGSGWTAVRGQSVQDTPLAHFAGQAVVLFPSAHDAAAFFTASSQSWPACSNRRYTVTRPGQPDHVWTVGPISNTNGTLSTSKPEEGGNGWTCERALTVSNNVAIDVVGCSFNQSDSAVSIAHQIAAKVPTT
jgi:serine/threonine-protein kinase